VLHVAPEAAVGGPLAAVQEGDPIILDYDARSLELDIPAEEIVRRLDVTAVPARRYARGYRALYVAHVLQADEGCDFDFLKRAPDTSAEEENLPTGILEGWIGGW
jgi:dihydroxy-acid dehydratase